MYKVLDAVTRTDVGPGIVVGSAPLDLTKLGPTVVTLSHTRLLRGFTPKSAS
jgi:hypothetical protein